MKKKEPKAKAGDGNNNQKTGSNGVQNEHDPSQKL